MMEAELDAAFRKSAPTYPDLLDDLTIGGRVHNWRTYIPESLRAVWPQLTRREKLIAALVGESAASSEEWD